MYPVGPLLFFLQTWPIGKLIFARLVQVEEIGSFHPFAIKTEDACRLIFIAGKEMLNGIASQPGKWFLKLRLSHIMSERVEAIGRSIGRKRRDRIERRDNEHYSH